MDEVDSPIYNVVTMEKCVNWCEKHASTKLHAYSEVAKPNDRDWR